MIENLQNNNWLYFYYGFCCAGCPVSWILYFLYEKEKKRVINKYKKRLPNNTVFKMNRATYNLLILCKLDGQYCVTFKKYKVEFLELPFEIID